MLALVSYHFYKNFFLTEFMSMFYNKIQNSNPPIFEAVGCVVSVRNKILLLKRREDKPYPSRWGIPSGKIDFNETQIKTAVRELFEETGILVSEEQLDFIGTYHIITKDMSFLYSLFRCVYYEFPEIRINEKEHVRINWFTPQDCLRLPLMPNLEECLQEALGVLKQKPVQLDLFTGLPTNKEPSITGLESKVKNTFKKEIGGLKEGSERIWISSLGAPGAGKNKLFRSLLKKYTKTNIINTPDIFNDKTSIGQNIKRVFEEDDRSLVLRLQLDLLFTRFRNTLFSPDNSYVIESLYGNLAHSRALYRVGLLSDDEYSFYFRFYLYFSNLLPQPEKIIYFSTNSQELFNRIIKRSSKVKRRGYEKHYTLQYVSSLSTSYAEVAQELSQRFEVVSINTFSSSTKDILDQYKNRICFKDISSN